uniref:Uncharacterized protein n=1 Tax=Timema bartmani TaxID=61472 RepID=A0A7R9ESU3_9NEOP|nr:unnamed protein product [Timema bartmani]
MCVHLVEAFLTKFYHIALRDIDGVLTNSVSYQNDTFVEETGTLATGDRFQSIQYLMTSVTLLEYEHDIHLCTAPARLVSAYDDVHVSQSHELIECDVVAMVTKWSWSFKDYYVRLNGV